MSKPCFWPPSRTRCSWGIAALLLVSGCGTSDYENLVNQRISELRNPTAQWRDFASPTFGYLIEAPVQPKVDTDAVNGTERLTMPVQGTMFQLQFVENSDKSSLQEAADGLRDLYSGQGFAMSSEGEENVNGLKCWRMRFTKPDSDETAMVQAFFITDQRKMCAMAVVGDGYSQEDAARFLGSFSAD